MGNCFYTRNKVDDMVDKLVTEAPVSASPVEQNGGTDIPLVQGGS